ncbi:hypothetical protein EV44_g1930 [Erysiphe necator]|uniref:Uncharacterized protein n=1 Tax=Uncinula necator TaxID=52586 RepID=A0A0B1P8K0_UNCNE|nr:hypothetical protein EV44_g1930 [Erysiphe necator]
MSTISQPVASVDFLILGAGWTAGYLIPLLKSMEISYAATTTTGRDGTYKFKFEYDPNTNNQASNIDLKPYAQLPYAKTILITFPIAGELSSLWLINTYNDLHREMTSLETLWVQLGSTNIYNDVEAQELWISRKSCFDSINPRAMAEVNLLRAGGCVLNLAGLWGGQRIPMNWLPRVASTKQELGKLKSLHLIHGKDVARAIVAVHQNPHLATSQRYLITDLIIHDWWEIALGLGALSLNHPDIQERNETYAKWINGLMQEQNVKALPRTPEQLSRCLDSSDFWFTFRLMPRNIYIYKHQIARLQSHFGSADT